MKHMVSSSMATSMAKMASTMTAQQRHMVATSGWVSLRDEGSREGERERARANTGTHRQTQIHTGTRRHTQAHTGTHRHTQAHAGTHRHTQAHTQAHTGTLRGGEHGSLCVEYGNPVEASGPKPVSVVLYMKPGVVVFEMPAAVKLIAVVETKEETVGEVGAEGVAFNSRCDDSVVELVALMWDEVEPETVDVIGMLDDAASLTVVVTASCIVEVDGGVDAVADRVLIIDGYWLLRQHCQQSATSCTCSRSSCSSASSREQRRGSGRGIGKMWLENKRRSGGAYVYACVCDLCVCVCVCVVCGGGAVCWRVVLCT